MNILLKQRLIGAVVLVSLAVIFIPMFFTSQKDKSEQKFESSIPPEPTYEIKSPQISLPLPLPPPALEKVPLSEPQAEDESQDTPKNQPQEATASAKIAAGNAAKSDQKPAAQNTSPKPSGVLKSTGKSAASGAVSKAKDAASAGEAQTNTSAAAKPPAHQASPVTKPKQATTVASAKPSTKPSAKVSPAAPQKSATLTGWVVQVGSFSHQANAEKLRDKLRKMGLASFVASGKNKGKPVYRVRVGPEFERTDADKIRVKIKAKTKLNGLVMKYP